MIDSSEFYEKFHAMGMSRLEIGADVRKISGQLVNAMKERDRGTGFGVSGPVACGKTMAVAAIAMFHHQTGNGIFAKRFKWVSWPSSLIWLNACISRGAGKEAEDFVELCSTEPVLVLDDLGAERIKGNYADDWGACQLDRIIENRYRAVLPTVYTTNLNAEELYKRYGGRMYRRLVLPNPICVVVS